jgi:hypothetical protein
MPAPPPTSLPLLLVDEDVALDELLPELVVPGFSSMSPHATTTRLESVAATNTKATLFIIISLIDAWTNQAVKARVCKGSVAAREYHSGLRS